MNNTELLKDDKVIELLKALGKAYLENGENDKAAEKFRQLFSHNPEDPELALNYATVLVRMNAVDEPALKTYSAAISLNNEDRDLYLNLAKLFLDNGVTADPTLRVFRRALTYSPPFEAEIRAAFEKVFKETTETITIPEIRDTLLDCIDNPELLSVFLATAWRDNKYDETLEVLRELYLKSDKKDIYLDAICNTLLQHKSYSEETGQYFALQPVFAQYALKKYNIFQPVMRIREVENYLDYKNLFLGFHKNPNSETQDNEFEFFLLDKSFERLEEITETVNIPLDINPYFNLQTDLLGRIGTDPSQLELKTPTTPQTEIDPDCNTIAIFEISNFDGSPVSSKLPFQTFLKLIATELVKSYGVTLCTTEDGLIAISTNPGRMLNEAIDILEKVERYNHVVEDFELIELRATIHCSPVPFNELDQMGIREIRKAFKIQNLSLPEGTNGVESAPGRGNCIRVSDEISNQVDQVKLKKLGNFRLQFLPHEHTVLEVTSKGPVKSKNDEPKRIRKYGKYEITETLRETSLGGTYRGYDPQLERPVIIKSFATKTLTEIKHFAALKKQFYDEIRNLNRMNQASISVIYDAGEQADSLYLVREFIDGTTLSDFMGQQKRLTVADIVEMFLRICKVVSIYHQSNVLHRNIRPNNIFLMNRNELKLVDGGVLQLWQSEEIRIDEVDVLAYSAPEQVQRSQLNQACDIFQIGVVLYECLTGINPFHADSAATVRMKILVDNPKPVSSIRKDLPKSFDDLLDRTFSKNPDKRPATIKEFEAELRGLIAGKEASKGRLFEII